MKKIFTFTIIVLFVFLLSVCASAAHVLIEAETGEVLLADNETEQLPISSLAKIMTLLILAEEIEAGKISLSDSVPAPAEVMALKAPVIWLNPGEVMSAGELAKAVIINSANDATLALAVYISNNAEEFTARMNSRAAELGMTDTFFADPGGFDEKTISTARDVALMTAELFKKHEIFGEHFTTRLSAVRENTEREAQLVNTNKLAMRYDGILGGKAGQSSHAGFCVTNSAQRGELRLVSVILSSKDEDERFALCEKLLDSGFADFEFAAPGPDIAEFSPIEVLRGVEKVVPATPAVPVRFIAPRGEGSRAKFEFSMAESVTAPVEKGQVLGNLTVRLGEKVVFECDIIAVHAVEELTFKKSLEILLERFFNNY